MSKTKVVALAGNFRRPSSTLALTNAVAEALRRKTSAEVVVYDLLDLDESVCTFDRSDLSEQSSRIVTEMEEADGLIVATPVYKGAYCGLMKHIIDLMPPESLYETPVLLCANGGGPRHSLVVEHQLRPLFGFFEADTIPTGIYTSASDFVDGRIDSEIVIGRVEKATDQMARRLVKST